MESKVIPRSRVWVWSQLVLCQKAGLWADAPGPPQPLLMEHD